MIFHLTDKQNSVCCPFSILFQVRVVYVIFFIQAIKKFCLLPIFSYFFMFRVRDFFMQVLKNILVVAYFFILVRVRDFFIQVL